MPPRALWLGLGPLLSLSSLHCQALGSRLLLQTVSFLRAVAVPSTLVLDRSPREGSRAASREPRVGLRVSG